MKSRIDDIFIVLLFGKYISRQRAMYANNKFIYQILKNLFPFAEKNSKYVLSRVKLVDRINKVAKMKILNIFVYLRWFGSLKEILNIKMSSSDVVN